jgi:hypothetical protein
MAIRIRKIGHSHKLTVPTVRKGLGIAQAGRQVQQNKSTVEHPGAGFGPYDQYKSGGTIHINPKNKGKFNATKKATGKTTEELTHSSNPTTRKRAIFAQNARKWHHHPNGGWIQEYMDGGQVWGIKAPLPDSMKGYYGMSGKQYMLPYDEEDGDDIFKRPGSGKAIGLKFANGGRTINPAMGGQMIGGQHAYPPLAPYPAMYGFGGVLQSFAPFLDLIPGVGGMASNMLVQEQQQKQDEEDMVNKKQQYGKFAQNAMQPNARPTFSWGGRLPETMLPISPSGLTLGHVPGYDSNSNYGGTNVPPEGWNYRMVKGKGEGTNWHKDTNMNVRRHTYAMGGEVPVELEKQEVFQEPNGEMGQVNGPSHEEGGVNVNLPENSFIWSDKLKTSKGRTFADEAARLGRMKAKYEKILKG